MEREAVGFALKSCVLFRGLSSECVEEKLLPLGQLHRAAKGESLLVPRQRVEGFSVIVSGRVSLTHLFSNGGYTLLNVLGQAEVLGAELAFSGSRLSPYHAIAAEPTTVCHLPPEVLTRPGILSEEEHRKGMDALLFLLANESVKKEYRLAILARRGLRERIMAYFTLQRNKQGGDAIEIPFSREELAAFLCVNRSALSHELSLMEQEGLITFRKNRFTLLFDGMHSGEGIVPQGVAE